MDQDPKYSDWLAPAAPAGPSAPASRRRIKTIGLVAAGVVAGGVLAGAIGASAATSGSSSSSGTPNAESSMAPRGPLNGYGPPGMRADAKPVSAAIEAQLKKKALAKLPGATVHRVVSGVGDAAYVAFVTKADGTPVMVKFDKNLNVTAVEARPAGAMRGPGGMGHGCAGPEGAAPSSPAA